MAVRVGTREFQVPKREFAQLANGVVNGGAPATDVDEQLFQPIWIHRPQITSAAHLTVWEPGELCSTGPECGANPSRVPISADGEIDVVVFVEKAGSIALSHSPRPLDEQGLNRLGRVLGLGRTVAGRKFDDHQRPGCRQLV